MWKWLFGLYLGFVLLFFAFVGGWTWARDDFFPRKLTLSAPPQGPNRVAVVSDFDLQSDANHSIRLNGNGKWRKWTDVVTQSELADQNWKLVWSRDGSLVAVKQSPGMTGDKRVKSWFYVFAYDWKKQKFHQSLDSWEEQPRSPFSRQIDALMKQRGGGVAGRETKRDVGVWRWEDRALKDAM